MTLHQPESFCGGMTNESRSDTPLVHPDFSHCQVCKSLTAGVEASKRAQEELVVQCTPIRFVVVWYCGGAKGSSKGSDCGGWLGMAPKLSRTPGSGATFACEAGMPPYSASRSMPPAEGAGAAASKGWERPSNAAKGSVQSTPLQIFASALGDWDM